MVLIVSVFLVFVITKHTIKAVKWTKKNFAFHYIKGDPQGKYRQQFIEKMEGKSCIGFLVPINTVGDIRTIKEKCKASSKLGIDSYIFEFPFYWDEKIRELSFRDLLIKYYNSIVNYFYKPAFVVTYVPSQYPITDKKIPNFLVIRCESPPDNFLWKADFRQYDAYISYQRYGKEYLTTQHIFDKFPRPILYGYPSVAFVDYKPLKFNKIFYPSANWDTLRTSDKYKKFLKRLSDDGIIQFFGPKNHWHKEGWNFIKNTYGGFISDRNNEYHRKMQSLGISLILSSQDHLDGKTPSGRIFESAAASTLIISDELSFVKEEFGDSVLYVDTNQEEKEIYNQIKRHFDWIQTHPKEASEMARRAHKIFADKFAAEKEILEYFSLYDEVMKNKRDKNSLMY